MLANIAKDIDAFIAQYPPATQKLLKQLRAAIHKAHKGLEEAIAYGIPTFRLHKKNVVHFSGYEHHIGFYPGAAGIEKFMPEFKGYQTSKGTVQFPINKPLPVDLITRIVKWRAEMEELKAAVKKKPAVKKVAKKVVKKDVKKAVKPAAKKKA
jgi:uncharacterized protein YdhG (YjbR/CyaY superfamily)